MERVILLTSTVKPYIGGFAGTVEKRLQEYEDAISYYLQETTFDIVVVDNSNYLFRNSNKRLRSYTFLADPEDFKYGKGFGEAKIISYAFKHDAGLQKAEQVIKITGRHKISNINKLILQTTLVNTIYADCNWGYTVNLDISILLSQPILFFRLRKDIVIDKPVITTLGRIFFYTLPAVLLDIFFRCLTTLSIYAQQSCQR